MAIDYTTTAMLSLLRLKAMLSDTDTTFTDANLLALMNNELSGYLVPAVMGWGAEYFVKNSDSTTTAGVSEIAIPARAINTDVRDVQVILPSDTLYTSRPRISPEEAPRFGSTNGTVEAYYLAGDSIFLCPPPTADQSLRIKYFRRPNQLVKIAGGAEIILTVSTPSVTMASTSDLNTAPLVADIIKATPPFDSAVDAVTYTVTNATTLGGLSTPIAASQIAVGSYFCVQGQSPVAQLPLELGALLMERSIAAVYSAKNKPDEAKAHYALAEMAAEQAKKMLPRTQGLPQKILNPYAPGFGRAGFWMNHGTFGDWR